jgi:hypothetical protein
MGFLFVAHLCSDTQDKTDSAYIFWNVKPLAPSTTEEGELTHV